MTRVGEVVRMRSWKHGRDYVCRVVSVRDTKSQPITRKTLKQDPHVPRGRFLVVGQSADGRFHSAYEDTDNLQSVNPLVQAFHNWRGKLPKKKELT